ncbi:site-specific integrase [Burkholderia pyrrocinia]
MPGEVDAAITYLADALDHVVYTRWTLAVVKQRYPSLAEAKAAKPAVMRLLLDQSTAIEYWDRGRARVVPAIEAPAPDTVVERVLRAHARRFRCDTGSVALAAIGEKKREPSLVTSLPLAVLQWGARAGRYANPSGATNTLDVGDDAQVIVLFLRDRGSRSAHTTRAYVMEIRRLAAWCLAHELGPLSDLTRHDLLAYRRALHHPARDVDDAAARSLTAASPACSGTGRKRAI